MSEHRADLRTRIFVSIELDDPKLKEYDAVSKLPGVTTTVFPHVNKMSALNNNLSGPGWDIVWLLADDCDLLVHGYDRIIQEDMQKYFPDTDGVLNYDDGIQGEKLCTHPVMGRKYYERFGYVFNPMYKAYYCDPELTDIANRDKKLVYIPSPKIFVHNHHSKGNFKKDYLDELDDANERHDMELYFARKAAGFPAVTGEFK